MKKGTISILICMFIWGLSFINIKVAIEFVGPMTLGFIRFAIASTLLFVIVKLGKYDYKIERKDIKHMISTAIFGITLYFFFENNGIKYTNASIASLIIAGIPIFTLIGDRLVYKTKMNTLSITAVIINLLGVFLIVGRNVRNIFNASGSGYLYMLGAVLSWVAYSLLSKKLYTKYSSLIITLYQSIFGTIMFLPFIFFEENHFDIITGEAIINILILAVFASAIAMILYTKSMEQLGAFVSSLYLNLIPIVTIAFGFLLLGEKLSLMEFAGGGLILVSVIIPRLEFSRKARD